MWINTSGAEYVANFTNCVFAACVNDGGDGGGIFSVYSASAVVRDCLFDGNSAQKNGGGAVKGSYYDCVFSNNVAVTTGRRMRPIRRRSSPTSGPAGSGKRDIPSCP